MDVYVKKRGVECVGKLVYKITYNKSMQNFCVKKNFEYLGEKNEFYFKKINLESQDENKN